MCPSNDCGVVLEDEEIRYVSDSETFSRFYYIFQTLRFRRFERLLLSRTLEADPSFRWCANGLCSAGQFIENGGTCFFNCFVLISDNISYFTCFSCGLRNCFSCRTQAHPTITCLQYQAFLVAERTPADANTIHWINNNTMRCPPPCNVPIEKNDGCDHMTCTRCKAEWCWLCGADYNKIRREGNTAHMRNCRHFA